MAKKIIKIISIIVVISCITMMFTSCKKEVVVPVDFKFGNFEKNYTDVDFALTALDSNIINGTDKLAAMEHILLVAEDNYNKADHVAKVAMGSGEAYTGPAGGEMTVRSLYLRNDSSYYYQIGGRITAAKPAAALGAAQGMLGQARREYSADMATFYQQEPAGAGDATLIETFPYVTNTYTEAVLETFNLEEYKLERKVKEDIGEFTSFVFSHETVLAETVNIIHNDEFGYYTMNFELNLTDTEARNIATEFPRASLRKISNSDNIEYKIYQVTMEIWDNGLIRSFATVESWEGKIRIAVTDSWSIPLDGSSTSTNKDYYSWDPEDSSYDELDIDLSWVPTT